MICFYLASIKFDILEICLSGWNISLGSKGEAVAKLSFVRFSGFKLALHRNHSRSKKGERTSNKYLSSVISRSFVTLIAKTYLYSSFS